MHDQSGVIGTTGPEMRRFFFTVDEAVALVRTGLDRAGDLHGKILSREMKAAQIQEILDVWIDRFGGRWERIEGRPGERRDEYLIGDLELEHATELNFDGVRHFMISFNERAERPISVGLSSANADRLTSAEILDIIEQPPAEER